MDLGKTPMGGFSNGEREFGIFNSTKPRACRSRCGLRRGLACDAGLGYVGARGGRRASLLTLACVDGDPACNAGHARMCERRGRQRILRRSHEHDLGRHAGGPRERRRARRSASGLRERQRSAPLHRRAHLAHEQVRQHDGAHRRRASTPAPRRQPATDFRPASGSGDVRSAYFSGDARDSSVSAPASARSVSISPTSTCPGVPVRLAAAFLCGHERRMAAALQCARA